MNHVHMLNAAFDPLQVVTSIIIAIVASYAALALSAQVGSRSGAARLPWLIGGGLAVGLGIAAMHFVGMLAMKLPVAVAYDSTLTIVSFVVAVIASTAALAAATSATLRIGPMLIASTLFGAGVSGMHYVGMAAMRGPFTVSHNLTRVALSLAIAVVAAAVAFWLAYQLRNASGRRGFALQLASATVMGAAITGMHYTAMSAVHFSAQASTAPGDLGGIAHNQLGTLVTVVGLVVLGGAILVAFLDQRARHAAREAALTNERYREMAEAMPQIVWTARPDGLLDYYNRRWSEYTGIPTEQALEIGWAPAVDPDDFDFTLEQWTNALARGEPLDIEIRLKRASDGESRWHLVRAMPVRADGVITKWFGTCTDIHEQKRAEVILRDRQVTLEHRIEDREAVAERATALYQLLAENATDMVSTHTPDGAFDYATPSWAEYVGADLTGRRPIDFCHEEDFARVAANHTLALRSSQLVTTVWRCQRADGSYGWLETRTRGVRDSVTQRVRTFVCATHDVSDRKLREQEIELLHAVVLAVSGAPHLDAALDVTLRQVCATTGWTYGEAWLPSSDGEQLERSSVWHVRGGTDATALAAASDGLSVKRDEGLVGTAWATAEVNWVRDLTVDSRTPRTAEALAAGLWAGVVVPVTTKGVVVAVLVFMMPTTVADDARRVALVSVVGAQLGTLVARLRDEQALRESEEKYRQLVEQAADAILLVDSDGRCVEANTRAAVLLGRSALELIGQPMHSLMSSDIAGAVEMPVVQTGDVLTAEYWIHRADGMSIPVEASAALLPDRRVQIIARDISGRKELERLKDEFLSVVSHELRTPLTSIRGSLGLLASGSLNGAPEKGQRMLDVAVANTDRLIRLINDILDVERINSGTVPMEPSWCEGSTLARSVTETLRPMADRAGVALQVHGCPTRLWADPDRITQALTNLVGNAIKFSPAGSTVELNISLTNGSTTALFEVRDHGRGIPADKLEIIFERFQQVDASDAREKGGTGLGLAITRGIVRQHGGRIWAENALDGHGGTSFKFSLPMRAKGEVDRDDVSVPDESGAVRDRLTRILVIEDDVELAHVIATALEAHGFEVDVTHNGVEAVERHRVSNADVLIVDLSLPDINGLDLLERIRAGHQSVDAPAIIYTASDPNSAARDRIRTMGAELATKSRVSTDALVERVIRLLEARAIEPLKAAS